MRPRTDCLPAVVLLTYKQVHNVLVLRLSLPDPNQNLDPAALLAALQKGEEKIVMAAQAEIPMDPILWLRPYMKKVITAILQHLFGKPIHLSSRTITPLSSRNGGISGSGIATAGFLECHGRGGLHLHCILWTGSGSVFAEHCRIRGICPPNRSTPRQDSHGGPDPCFCDDGAAKEDAASQDDVL